LNKMAETTVQKNALEMIQERFASYGIQGLAETIRNLIAKYTSDNEVATSLVMADLRKTPEYERRFAGNIERAKKIKEDVDAGRQPRYGLLSESEYIKAEEDYRTILSDYTLPGFYDTPESYVNLIANNTSPKEVQGRAMAAQQAASSANPEIKAQLKAMYGIEENNLTAYFLDPEVAKTALKPIAASNAATIAAAAQRSGLQITPGDAERISGQLAPGATDFIASDSLFQQTALTAGLTQGSVSGEASTVGAEEVLTAAAGNVEAQAKLARERQKRLAEYQSASGMAETQKGVVGLQRANL
jgi:hypothetical protein